MALEHLLVCSEEFYHKQFLSSLTVRKDTEQVNFLKVLLSRSCSMYKGLPYLFQLFPCETATLACL